MSGHSSRSRQGGHFQPARHSRAINDPSSAATKCEDSKRNHFSTERLCMKDGFAFAPMVVDACGDSWRLFAGRMLLDLANTMWRDPGCERSSCREKNLSISFLFTGSASRSLHAAGPRGRGGLRVSNLCWGLHSPHFTPVFPPPSPSGCAPTDGGAHVAGGRSPRAAPSTAPLSACIKRSVPSWRRATAKHSSRYNKIQPGPKHKAPSKIKQVRSFVSQMVFLAAPDGPG